MVILIGGCDRGSATSAKGEAGPKTKTKVDIEADAPDAAAAEVEMGTIRPTDAIDLGALVNRSPDQVEAVLGPPAETGSDRISCVRFVPERVFFACEQEIRTYEHPGFERVRIDFEDGKAAQVSIIGVPGSGAFDPVAALASVGVSLPDEPRTNTETLTPVDGSPGGTATIWDWGNSSARLLVDGLQHRVRVSVVDGDWARSKIEIINNNPLDDDQKARIKPVRGQETAESPPSSTPASP